MSDTTMEAANNVLHIRPPSSQAGCGGDMDALLTSASLHVDTCSDVYRGLARLCRGAETTHRAVIVCMDGLGTAELEFFSVVARVRPRTPAYVYGNKRARQRITQAIELGARGEATEEVIRTLAVPAASSTSDSAGSESSSEAACVQQTDPSKPPAKRPQDEVSAHGVSDEAVAPIDEDDNALSHPVRVPWLRRDGVPVRGRPHDRDPSRNEADSNAPAATHSPVDRLHEPLLTDEELQALMGDDVAAVAPEQQDPAGVDDRNGGGGRS